MNDKIRDELVEVIGNKVLVESWLVDGQGVPCAGSVTATSSR